MRTKLILFSLFSIITSGLYAQIQNIDNYQEISMYSQLQNNKQLRVNGDIINTKDLEGSPYLQKEFKKGFIEDTEQGKTIEAYLRYRIIDDMFEISKKSNPKEISVLKRGTNYNVRMGNKKFRFIMDYPIELKGTYSGYAEVMFEKENISLYKRITQDYTPKKKMENGYASSSSSKASLDNEEYYFIETNDEIIQIEPHKKRAADAFPDHTKELENYIKDKKLKFRGDDEEKDLIQLVEFYNTL
mgnify:CR=1 FL=1